MRPAWAACGADVCGGITVRKGSMIRVCVSPKTKQAVVECAFTRRYLSRTVSAQQPSILWGLDLHLDHQPFRKDRGSPGGSCSNICSLASCRTGEYAPRGLYPRSCRRRRWPNDAAAWQLDEYEVPSRPGVSVMRLRRPGDVTLRTIRDLSIAELWDTGHGAEPKQVRSGATLRIFFG